MVDGSWLKITGWSKLTLQGEEICRGATFDALRRMGYDIHEMLRAESTVGLGGCGGEQWAGTRLDNLNTQDFLLVPLQA